VKTHMTVNTEMDIALEALERIAQHERECGERWAEAVVELRELKKVADSHAARWEKLAWLVVTVVITTGATVITSIVI
tara:strand:- start:103 stop:336 length:234 start_codon:yes stop_codon:yes gene_type:complete